MSDTQRRAREAAYALIAALEEFEKEEGRRVTPEGILIHLKNRLAIDLPHAQKDSAQDTPYWRGRFDECRLIRDLVAYWLEDERKTRAPSAQPAHSPDDQQADSTG